MNPLSIRKSASRALACVVPMLMALALSAGASAQVYESPNAGPLRTISDGDDGKLMLYGYDAVAYFWSNEAKKGDPAIKAEHLGVTWRFSSEANKAEFLKSPEKYMPQFGGYCSNGINYAITGGGGGGPNSWRIYRGKLYVFGGQSARDHFEMDTELNLQRAHKYWNEELTGANPRWMRLKRFVFRVDHYKSDRALQEEWEAKLAAKTLPVMPGAPQVVPAR
jgi:YHS domain-containing protein